MENGGEALHRGHMMSDAPTAPSVGCLLVVMWAISLIPTEHNTAVWEL